MFKFPVMKLCNKQLRDIDPDDILFDYMFRKCNTYHSGGGYDQFESIYNKRNYSNLDLRNQFVVQLKGCPLNCPYCYVTTEGVNSGESVYLTENDLVHYFKLSNCKVFHLMGGAPALYMEHWSELIDKLFTEVNPYEYVFHSDFLLIEKQYDEDTLMNLRKYLNTLYAVSIKGSDSKEFMRNTRKLYDSKLLFDNLELLVKYEIPFYVTFTNMTEDSICRFKEETTYRFGPNISDYIFRDSFSIPLIHYKALD